MLCKFEQLKTRGQGLVEYALILTLVAIMVIVALSFVGQKSEGAFSTLGSTLIVP